MPMIKKLILYPLSSLKSELAAITLFLQIQVIQDDRNNRSGTFSTAGKGMVPPLVTTQFITSDQGKNISLKKTLFKEAANLGFPNFLC